MNSDLETKLYSSMTVDGSVPRTLQEAEVLFARADREIELRVRTPFSTTEEIVAYAQELSRTADRVLVSVRRADWHNPFVRGDSPHPMLTHSWVMWVEERERERRKNLQIRVVNEAVDRAIEAAEGRAAQAQLGKPPKKRQADDLEPLKVFVPVEKVLWIARELAGVSEITFSPRLTAATVSSTYPITATFATALGLEAVEKGVALLGAGKTPLKAAEEIIWRTGGTVSEAMRARTQERHETYLPQWEAVCAARGYDPTAGFRPCVCREYAPPTRDFSEAVDEWAKSLFYPEPHKPECYERAIDNLMYCSDWNLAEARMADAVGKRHALIAHHRSELAKARKAEAA